MNQVHPSHMEALREIDSVVTQLIANHEHYRKPRFWFPSELLPEGFEGKTLPPELEAMLYLNLMTEDGLPYFLGLLVTHLGDQSALWKWIRMWTAEEERHGQVIGLYLAKVIRRDRMIAIEKLRHAYLENPFWPDHWSRDPYKLIAYVVVQEMATHYSHAGITRRAASVDPVLWNIMGKVSGEEKRHHLFYLQIFKALIAIDPSHSLISLEAILAKFEMPGSNIPSFSILSTIQERAGLFGPGELSEIIKLVCKEIAIEGLSGLSSNGERARDNIIRRGVRLRNIADRRSRQPVGLYTIADLAGLEVRI